jgi:hypothetical protein
MKITRALASSVGPASKLECGRGNLSVLLFEVRHLFVNRIFDLSLCSAYHDRSLTPRNMAKTWDLHLTVVLMPN